MTNPESNPILPNPESDYDPKEIWCQNLSQGDALRISYENGSTETVIVSRTGIAGLTLGGRAHRFPIFEDYDTAGQENNPHYVIMGSHPGGTGLLAIDRISEGGMIRKDVNDKGEVITPTVNRIEISPLNLPDQWVRPSEYVENKEAGIPIAKHTETLMYLDGLLRSCGHKEGIVIGEHAIGSEFVSENGKVHFKIEPSPTYGVQVFLWDELTGEWYYANYLNGSGQDSLKVGYANTSGTNIGAPGAILADYDQPTGILRANVDVVTHSTSPNMQMDVFYYNPGATTKSSVLHVNPEDKDFTPEYYVDGDRVELKTGFPFVLFENKHPVKVQEMRKNAKVIVSPDGQMKLSISREDPGVVVSGLHERFQGFCEKHLNSSLKGILPE